MRTLEFQELRQVNGTGDGAEADAGDIDLNAEASFAQPVGGR